MQSCLQILGNGGELRFRKLRFEYPTQMTKIFDEVRDIDAAAVQENLRPPAIIDKLSYRLGIQRSDQELKMIFSVFDAS